MRVDCIIDLGEAISTEETLPTITDLQQVRNKQYLNEPVMKQTRQIIYTLSLIMLIHFVKAHLQVKRHIKFKPYENHKQPNVI